MTIVKYSIGNPVKVTVGMFLILLFGFLSFYRIPVQLTPTVDRPTISVSTIWQNASPEEVERQIIQEQEDKLKSVEGLIEMKSESKDGQGDITLKFPVGTDLDAALLKVSNKLNQVPEYPATAEEPVISSVSLYASVMAFFAVKKLPGNDVDINTLYDFFDDHVVPRLERVPGVAAVRIFGGQEREMRVLVNLDALAARRITLGEFAQALDRENRNTSAGDFEEGKRRYVVRTLGEFASPQDVENVIVAWRDSAPIYVRDVASVELGYKDLEFSIRHMGESAIVLGCLRETGYNVLEVMQRIRETVAELNEGILKERGLYLYRDYDESDYVNKAIALVEKNLVVGAILAVVVLLIFLRSPSSTLVIALAIPISVVGSFLMLTLMGRNLNLVSLAGMCFAVGMVVDSAIVVLENIYRHLQMGKARRQAAYDGTTEVWGAILASALTTMAVFIPVLFVEEEVGQLFRDIALAISSAVGLSLIAAITVIPCFSARVLSPSPPLPTEEGIQRRSFLNLWGLGHLPARVPQALRGLTYWLCGKTSARLMVAAGLTCIALGASWLLMPGTEYLPTGNKELVLGVLIPPPGYGVREFNNIGVQIEDEIMPYCGGELDAKTAAAQGKPIRFFAYVGHGRRIIMLAYAYNYRSVPEVMALLRMVLSKVPGTFSVVLQQGIFQEEFLKGRSIDIEITGPELPRLVALGGRIFGQLRQELPEAQIRPIPSLELGSPEVQIIPDRERAAKMHLTSEELGSIVSSAVDGLKASDYQYYGDEIDLTVIGANQAPQRSQDFEQLLVRTREGRIRLSGTADKLTAARNALRGNFLLAVLITYLLMCGLFESFLFPFVIMFSVPLAGIGGFIGLRLVSRFVEFQQLDIIAMLGFVILVGVVVNNAILIVHQALNFMRNEQMGPREAIAESVRTRVRPIFMTTTTTLGALLPLALVTGPGSELYRGLGGVVLGGLVSSTIFTLVLVPTLFSLVLDAKLRMTRAVRGEEQRTPAP